MRLVYPAERGGNLPILAISRQMAGGKPPVALKLRLAGCLQACATGWVRIVHAVMSTTLPYQGLFPLSRLQAGVLAGAAVAALIVGAWTAASLSDRAQADRSTAPAEVSSLAPRIGTPILPEPLLPETAAHGTTPSFGLMPELRIPATGDALPAVALASVSSRAPQPVSETEPRISALVPESTPRPAMRPASLVTRVSLRTASAEAASETEPVATAPVTLAAAPTIAPLPASPDTCARNLTRDIPRRAGNAASGSAVLAALDGVGGSTRDSALARELASGNLPGFLRRLVPVTLTGTSGGAPVRITVCVMPDYLAVGSDRDYVRVPLGLPAAAAVADRFGFMLPTTELVDAIYRQASLRLPPRPMTPGAAMTSTAYMVQHNATIESQRQQATNSLGLLMAGHKKDLVVSNRLWRNPGRVAIYGWHQPNGRAIQPLSTVHGAEYADYSHGVRLVARTAYLNGRATDLEALLSDPSLAGFLSDEGPISRPAVLLASLSR